MLVPPFGDEEIDHLFTYHDDKNKVPRYVAVREAAKTFAKILIRATPPGPDQSAAVRLLRECVMTANASIALEKPQESVTIVR